MVKDPGDGQLGSDMSAVRTGMGRRVVVTGNGIIGHSSIERYLPLFLTGNSTLCIFSEISCVGKYISYAVGNARCTVDQQAGTQLDDGVPAHQQMIRRIACVHFKAMACRVAEAHDGVDAAQQRHKRVRLAITFACRQDLSLVKTDPDMHRSVYCLRLYFQRIDPGLSPDLLTAAIVRMSGIKSIPAGVQDIEPATRWTRDLPGRDAAAAFSRGIQPYIYVIILRLFLIIESQIADGAVLHIAFLHMDGMKILISVYESNILQQLIEDPELFRVSLLTFGVFNEMNDKIGGSNAFFMLKERELGMIAQFVSEQTRAFIRISPEQGRAFFAIALTPGLSKNKG